MRDLRAAPTTLLFLRPYLGWLDRKLAQERSAYRDVALGELGRLRRPRAYAGSCAALKTSFVADPLSSIGRHRLGDCPYAERGPSVRGASTPVAALVPSIRWLSAAIYQQKQSSRANATDRHLFGCSFRSSPRSRNPMQAPLRAPCDSAGVPSL